MEKKRMVKRVAVAAGFLFLCWAPGLTCGQNSAPGPAPTPQVISPGAQLKEGNPPPDDFAGLTYTAEQQAKIDQIRQTANQRIEAVKKDEKLSPEAQEAMLAGYRRMEIQELFQVLTPEQQAEVRKKAHARRAALQQAAQQKKQNRPPTPQ
jgi:Spy/CpxP family protein refolding chaperone